MRKGSNKVEDCNVLMKGAPNMIRGMAIEEYLKSQESYTKWLVLFG